MPLKTRADIVVAYRPGLRMTTETLPAGTELRACAHVTDCGHFWRRTEAPGCWDVLCPACHAEVLAGGVVVVPQLIALNEPLQVQVGTPLDTPGPGGIQ